MHRIFKIVLLFCVLQGNMLMAQEITHLPPAVPYDETVSKVNLSKEEWRKILTPAQFDVLRQKGTERAFTGKYNKFYQDGTYICAGCGNPLFSSKAKFDSGTGWPSFYQPLSEKRIQLKEDNLLVFIKRTEVVCNRCGGHLGHVFDDGPQPTGLRYCMNSEALSFVPK